MKKLVSCLAVSFLVLIITVPIGKLAAGEYLVIVTYSQAGGPHEAIGKALFTVTKAAFPTNPALEVTPNSLNFGDITVGQCSANQSFTVRNTGGGTLTGTASTSVPFSIVFGGSFSLGANQSAQVTVRFCPTTTGPANGNINFSSNGGNVNRNVSGNGISTPPPGPFRCKAGPGYTPFSKDYPGAIQVCPAHDNNYGKEGRASTGPLYIVIHNTAGGTTQSNIDLFQNPTRRASAHYLVGTGGEVIQMVSENHNAWHADANNRPLDGRKIISTNSIGIEIVGHSGDRNWPSPVIYGAVAALVKDIVRRAQAAGREIQLTRSYIVGHEEINRAGKWDPGPNWDWKIFMEEYLGGTYEPAMRLTATYNHSTKKVDLVVIARANGRDGFRIERSENRGPYEQISSISNVSRLLADNPATIRLPSDTPPRREVPTEYCYRVWAYVGRMLDGKPANYVNPSNEACVIIPTTSSPKALVVNTIQVFPN